jgi:hypothetical protein
MLYRRTAKVYGKGKLDENMLVDFGGAGLLRGVFSSASTAVCALQ